MNVSTLSNESQKGIILYAENYHDELALQLGILSGESKDEDEFLVKVGSFVDRCLGNVSNAIDGIFFERPPSKRSFELALETLKKNILVLRAIPKEKRSFDF